MRAREPVAPGSPPARRYRPPTWLVASILLTIAPIPASAQAYRWVDEQGNVHYSGTIDSIPERYRPQLQKFRPSASPAPPALPAPAPPALSAPTPAPGGERGRPASAERIRVALDEIFYDVTGSTEAQLRADLRSKKQEGHNALTRWKIAWTYPFAPAQGGRCATGPVTVDVTLTFVYPRWAPPPAVPARLRAQWHTILAGLRVHEDGHKDIVMKAAEEVQRTLEALPAASSCAELKQAASTAGHAVLERTRRRHDEYDATTRHGMTQGAHW